MTSSGESSVSYLCPQCQTKLTARAEDAGQRSECPQCGKVLKVPGSASRGKSSSGTGQARDGATSQTGGIANIPVVCPLCGTRMFAKKKQIGQTMVCPDCLESVVVPDLSPPKPKPRPIADPDTPAAAPTITPPPLASEPDQETADSDEYSLSEPVDLPRHRSVNKSLADLIDQHVDTADQSGTDHASPPPPPPSNRKSPPQFGFKCPVCDTFLHATEDMIGTQMECPDCFSSVQVTRPRKAQRVSEVVESDYKDDDYSLGAEAEMDVFRPTDKDVAPRTVGEEALQKARIEQAKRERETPQLPLTPLYTGVLDFLPNSVTIVRIIMTGALIAALLALGVALSKLISSDDASTKLLVLMCSVVMLILVIVTVSFTAINLLTTLQESAEGSAQIENWPENSLADWISECFAFVMPVFFAVTPGMLLIITAPATGLHTGIGWLFVGIGLYLFFPIAQLSVLETASIANPFSPAILQSIRDQFLLWCTFYIETFFIALLVGIFSEATAIAVGKLDQWVIVVAMYGMFLSFTGFLYFRLLGRLAWACQMRPLQDGESRGKKGKGKKQVPDDSGNSHRGESGGEQTP